MSTVTFPPDLVGELSSPIIQRDGFNFARMHEGLFRLHPLGPSGPEKSLFVIKFNGLKYLHRSTGVFDESVLSGDEQQHLNKMIEILDLTSPADRIRRIVEANATSHETIIYALLEEMKKSATGVQKGEDELSKMKLQLRSQVSTHASSCLDTTRNQKAGVELMPLRKLDGSSKKPAEDAAQWLQDYGFLGLSLKELSFIDGGVPRSPEDGAPTNSAQYRMNYRLLGVSAMHAAASVGAIAVAEHLLSLVQFQTGPSGAVGSLAELAFPASVMEHVANLVAFASSTRSFVAPLLVPALSKASANGTGNAASSLASASSSSAAGSKAGANDSFLPIIDLRDVVDCTPLHYAARKGQVSMFEWLLRNGANINAADLAGNTPLHEAAANGHLNIVKFIFEAPAELKASTSLGALQPEVSTFPFGNALSLAVGMGQREIVTYMIDKAKCKLSNASSYVHGTPATMAATALDLPLFKLLVKGGVDITATHPLYRYSLVQCAVRNTQRSPSEVTSFLDYLHSEIKSPLNLPDVYGVTAIFEAATQGRIEIVKWLAARGAPLSQSINGVPLIDAARQSSPELAKWMATQLK